jgi:hypothetical protein
MKIMADDVWLFAAIVAIIFIAVLIFREGLPPEINLLPGHALAAPLN